MKKNAFTLIELIAVIVILALIVSLVFPAVTGLINDSKEKAYNEQIRLIEEAGEKYFIDKPEELPELDTSKNNNVSIETLIDEGYIDNKKLKENQIENPKNKENITGIVCVTYDGKQYIYEYRGTEEDCK